MRATPVRGYALGERRIGDLFAEPLKARLRQAPAIPLDAIRYWDTVALATGVMAPLEGFMSRTEVRAVLESWRLSDGRVFPLPITLPVRGDTQRLIRSPLAGLTFRGQLVAALHVEDLYWLDPEEEAKAVYGTQDRRHPGVARVLEDSPIRVAGTVTLLEPPAYPVEPVLTPAALRACLLELGWRKVAAFQTRNPLHRAHEYLHKTVLEWVDGLCLHPLIGATKADDVPVAVRWETYRTLLAGYYPRERVLLSGYPVAMRYAGPREAVFHAVTRRNYGFTHFIVGRDHAGVGHFYPPDAAHQALARFSPAELGIEVIPAPAAFYCHRCQGMASERTCPHSSEDREVLSGTRVRATLAQGGDLPPTLIRPEVAEILRRYYRRQTEGEA
ncbi:MAG: sulfate adenylyltransferase [Firmicutes bacterium]|nr:sulfate adenylyltransferase [Alicyclobacillaceae bacterium]MCL6497640.1 sulfate adenylyltransferase [Bacillota bacterium]